MKDQIKKHLSAKQVAATLKCATTPLSRLSTTAAFVNAPKDPLQKIHEGSARGHHASCLSCMLNA